MKYIDSLCFQESKISYILINYMLVKNTNNWKIPRTKGDEISRDGRMAPEKEETVIVHWKICLQVLRDNTVQWYGWSFYLAWLGVATCLGTMTLFLIAATCLRREHAREQAQNIQYIMPGDAQTLKRPY